MVLTKEQKVFIIINLKLQQTVAELRDKFFEKFGFRPDYKTIHRNYNKFLGTGSVAHKKGYGRPTTTRTDENVESVCLSIIENPKTSIRRIATELGIGKSDVQKNGKYSKH